MQILKKRILVSSFFIGSVVTLPGHLARAAYRFKVNDPVEAAVELTKCNTKSNCLILSWKIKFLTNASSSQLSVEIPIMVDDNGGLSDIIPGLPEYYAKRRAKTFATQFIQNLCKIENGVPQNEKTKVTNIKEDFGRGEVYSPEPFAHMSDTFSDWYVITVQARAKCLME